jgi:osmotically inducible protein OsmC
MLTEAGHPPTSLDARADVEMSMEGGPHITGIRLSVRGDVPGLDAEGFRAHAEKAKAGCPISKLLSAVPIELEVQG